VRKIRNPYAAAGRAEYQFWEDGDEVMAKWMPRKSLEGFTNVLHGGIQATLLDELAAWVVQTRCKTVGVTSSMEIVYRRPVLVSAGEITLRGKVKEVGTRMAIIETELLGNDGKLCASAVVKYFLIHPDKAAEEYFYPGADAF